MTQLIHEISLLKLKWTVSRDSLKLQLKDKR